MKWVLSEETCAIKFQILSMENNWNGTEHKFNGSQIGNEEQIFQNNYQFKRIS